MRRRVLAALVALLAAAGLARAGDEDDPDAIAWYVDARRLVYDEDLPAAIELFGRVVAAHPSSDVADDALYMIGWCWERRADGEPRAVEAWLRLARRYGASPWLDEAAAGLARLGAADKIRLLLRERLAAEGAVAHRAADALAALGDGSVLPGLRDRLAAGDHEAAEALARLGRAGADALATAARDESRAAAERAVALEGFALAVREGGLDAAWVAAVVAELEKTHPNRRLVRSLRREVEPDDAKLGTTVNERSGSDESEQIARLERRVAALKEQVEALERIVAELERKR